MTNAQLEIAISDMIVHLTRHIMKVCNCSEDEAFRKLLSTTVYRLVSFEKFLVFEPYPYVIKAYDIEVKDGVEKMFDFICKE